MRRIISNSSLGLSKIILTIALVGLFNVIAWFTFFNQPSYADYNPDRAMYEIRKDMKEIDPQAYYEKAIEIDQDPKMGVEKIFEENLEEYKREHSDEDGGILGGAKDLIDKVTSNN